MNVIKVKSVSVYFYVPHSGADTLKESFVNWVKGKQGKDEIIKALDNVSFEVKKGECLGIIGENASGKTTLLKVIGGILKPDKGEVIVRGKVAPLLTLGVGFNEELTAKENVYLYGSLMGLSKETIDQRYEKIVNFSELHHNMDTKLKTFSDGMKMRLGFAVAINVDADILLVDEVLTVGDGAFQAKCLRKFEEFKREGKTVIFVSHGLDAIKNYCDRVILLHQGKIKEIGEPEKVIESYRRYLKNKELKTYNHEVLEKLKSFGIEDIKIYKDNEESWVLKRGDSLQIKVRMNVEKMPSEIFSSLINSSKEVRFYTKNIKNNLIEFNIKSLPLQPGNYKLFVEFGINETDGLEVIVLGGEDKDSVKIFSPNFSLDDEIYVFGKDCEKIFEKYENGEALVVYSNLEDTINGTKDGAIFNRRKMIFKGKVEEIIEKYKEKIVNKYSKLII
jgi:ABC-type polysaccharide/polyol phosphate transport system ATPase subunit